MQQRLQLAVEATLPLLVRLQLKRLVVEEEVPRLVEVVKAEVGRRAERLVPVGPVVRRRRWRCRWLDRRLGCGLSGGWRLLGYSRGE